MAKQVIGIGALPNDGTGDSLRVGMDKVNDNFTENYNAIALLPQKYSTTMNVTGGVLSTKVTTVTTEPYSLLILDSTDNDITDTVLKSWSIIGGFYALNITSVGDLNNLKIKVIY